MRPRGRSHIIWQRNFCQRRSRTLSVTAQYFGFQEAEIYGDGESATFRTTEKTSTSRAVIYCLKLLLCLKRKRSARLESSAPPQDYPFRVLGFLVSLVFRSRMKSQQSSHITSRVTSKTLETDFLYASRG